MSLSNLLATFTDEKEVIYNGHEYIEKDKEGISLKGVLQRGRLKLSRERKGWRQGQNFTPSRITYSYCRRLKVGQLAGLIDIYYEVAKPSEQVTFDIGNALHTLVQGYFWDIGILKGTFKCIKCDKLYHDLVSPTMCPSGKKTHLKKHLTYKEVNMSHPHYPVFGRCDGILIVEGEEHLVDIKSIQNRTLKSNERQFCFEDLDQQGPKQEHVIQVMFYMWMSEIHKGHLLYIAKNSGQIKTFDIPYNQELIQPYLDEIRYLLALSEKLKAGEKVELPVPCGRKECPCESVLSIR